MILIFFFRFLFFSRTKSNLVLDMQIKQTKAKNESKMAPQKFLTTRHHIRIFNSFYVVVFVPSSTILHRVCKLETHSLFDVASEESAEQIHEMEMQNYTLLLHNHHEN